MPRKQSASPAPSPAPATPSKGKKGRKVAAKPAVAGKNTSDDDDPSHTALVQFVEREGHFSLVRNFHLADAFTLMNGFCGAQSIFASGRYLLTSDPIHVWHALWFPLMGAVFDLLDGRVARWRNSSSLLGQELDSLADSISFGMAPAFAAYALGMRTYLDSIILTIFVCCGIARLARFNVTAASIPHDKSGKAKYFEGLPIPSSLILVGGMAIALLYGAVDAGPVGPIESHHTMLFSDKPSRLLRWSTQHLIGKEPNPNAVGWCGALASSEAQAARDAKRALGLSVVPGGTIELDPAPVVAALFNGLEQLKTIIAHKVPQVAQWPTLPTAEAVTAWTQSHLHTTVHILSFLWLAWAMALVSKTLKVPKP